jgi:corrinoid protein of di/trimethylamine methyltransferase
LESKEEVFQRLRNAIVQLDIDGIRRIAQEALDKGIPAYEAVMEGMSKGMEIVGKKFEEGEFFLSDLIMAGETMKAGMEVLKPHLKAGQVKSMGRVVIGTVKGDIHDIGKNIVSTLLSSAGFEVHDLGVDVDVDRFVKAVQEFKAHILAMSALLTVTMPYMEEVIKAVEKEGIRSQLKIIVGGAPLSEDYAKRIGADAYAEDAVTGVEKCKKLMDEVKRSATHG